MMAVSRGDARIDREREPNAALGLVERAALKRDDPEEIVRAEMTGIKLERLPAGALGARKVAAPVQLGGFGEFGI